jgi:hypothetical protein
VCAFSICFFLFFPTTLDQFTLPWL